jgi:hypothetical protein
MYRFHPFSLTLLAAVGVAAIPGGRAWLFSTVTVAACVIALVWRAVKPRHTAGVVRILYFAVVVIAMAGLAITLWNSIPKLAGSQTGMAVTLEVAPDSVDAAAEVLDAQASLLRETAPPGWRVLWFGLEILPFLAALATLLVLWPIARRPDEPFERRNALSVYAAAGILIVAPILLGIGRWALGRTAVVALGVQPGYGAEGTALLNVGALGAGLVLLALAVSLGAASDLREFERGVI